MVDGEFKREGGILIERAGQGLAATVELRKIGDLPGVRKVAVGPDIAVKGEGHPVGRNRDKQLNRGGSEFTTDRTVK
jgi:hypothetical protein